MKDTSLFPGLLVLLIALIVLGAASVLTLGQVSQITSAQNTPTSAAAAATAATVRVQAGTGNSTLPYDVFYPKQVQISPGQSVSWYNAAKVGVPHTVTFVTDNKTKAPLSAQFAVKNSSSFVSIPPGSNSQPVLLPPNSQNPSMTIISASNARASNPGVIDSTGKVTHLSHNSAYSVKGNEKFINSGLLFPQGKGPPNAGTSFTLTFEKAGTYNYYCIVHPWMKGKVVVS
jgi:plastocyanin